MEFVRERDSKLSHSDSHSRLQDKDDLTDIGFNIAEFSPIPTVGDMVPQTPAGSGTNTPVPTSTPRPNGGSCLNEFGKYFLRLSLGKRIYTSSKNWWGG